MSDDSTLLKTIRGTGGFIGQRFINSLLSAFIFIYAAQTLTQTEMGIYGTAMIIYSIICIIGGLGLPIAASRFTAYLLAKGKHGEAHQTARNILTISSLTATTILLIFVLSSQYLSYLTLKTCQHAQVFQTVSITAFATIIGSTFASFLLGLQKFKQLASFYLISQTVRFASTISLLTLGLGVPAIFLGLSAYHFLIITLALPTVFVNLFKKENVNKNCSTSFKPLLTFATPMMAYASMDYLIRNVDSLMVLGLIGVDALGLYTVAVTITNFILIVFASSFSDTLTPCMSDVHGRSGYKAVAAETKRLSRYTSFTFIPTAIGIAALSPLIVKIVGEQKYLNAAPLIAIISLGLATYFLSILIISVLVAIGKTGKAMLTMLLTLAITIGSTAILTANLGVAGTALSKTLSYLTLLGVSLYIGRKIIPINLDKQAILTSLTASGIMGLIVYYTALYTGFNLLYLPLYILIGTAIFGITLTTMKTLKLKDIQLISKTIPGGTWTYNKISKATNNSKPLTKLIQKLLA